MPNEMTFDSETLNSALPLIDAALDEDLQDVGDLTSRATVPERAIASVDIVSRDEGRLCGGVLIEHIYRRLAERSHSVDNVSVDVRLQDGSVLSRGCCLATVRGPVQQLLTGERVVLNFLIHLSGIATLTNRFVQKVEGTGAVILDTRKTLPGYRRLHKYAVLCGGGTNHRMGLFDGVLIKDNHLAARQNQSVASAVEDGRAFLNEQQLNLPIEVEVDTLEQLADVLQSRPDIVLLDNMPPSVLQQAVRLRDEHSPETLLEASGGITLESVSCVAGSGVDRISIGGLTHSAPAHDIGYDWSFQ